MTSQYRIKNLNVTLDSKERLKYFKHGNNMVRFAYQKSSAPVWRRDCGKRRLQGGPSLSRTLWLTAVTVEVDRAWVACFSHRRDQIQGQSDLWEEELIFGSWFLISFSLSWRGVLGGRSSLPGVDQGSVRSLQPEKVCFLEVSP